MPELKKSNGGKKYVAWGTGGTLGAFLLWMVMSNVEPRVRTLEVGQGEMRVTVQNVQEDVQEIKGDVKTVLRKLDKLD